MHARTLLTAAAVGATLLSGCGGGDSPKRKPASRATLPAVQALTSSVVPLRVPGGQAVVAMPRERTSRVVVFVHGAHGVAQGMVADPLRQQTTTALLSDGVAVAGADAYGDAWGTPRSVDAYAELVDQLRARGLTRVSVIAESMGGLAGTQLLERLRPRAWAGVYVVCDLRTMVSERPFDEEIAAAWGSRSRAAVQPVQVPTRVRGLRMLFEASPDDRTVDASSNTAVCASEARRAGARVTVRKTTGPHSDPSNWTRELAAFVSR